MWLFPVPKLNIVLLLKAQQKQHDCKLSGKEIEAECATTLYVANQN
jgi:hypothetical protein